jgi:hypothetical protein
MEAIFVGTLDGVFKVEQQRARAGGLGNPIGVRLEAQGERGRNE